MRNFRDVCAKRPCNDNWRLSCSFAETDSRICWDLVRTRLKFMISISSVWTDFSTLEQKDLNKWTKIPADYKEVPKTEFVSFPLHSTGAKREDQRRIVADALIYCCCCAWCLHRILCPEFRISFFADLFSFLLLHIHPSANTQSETPVRHLRELQSWINKFRKRETTRRWSKAKSAIKPSPFIEIAVERRKKQEIETRRVSGSGECNKETRNDLFEHDSSNPLSDQWDAIPVAIQLQFNLRGCSSWMSR